MKLFLINKNPIVKKLVKLSAEKVGLEFFSSESHLEIGELEYDVILIDDESLEEGALDALNAKFENAKLGLIHGKDSERMTGFAFFVQKPFLPTDLVDVLKSETKSISDMSSVEESATSKEAEIDEGLVDSDEATNLDSNPLDIANSGESNEISSGLDDVEAMPKSESVADTSALDMDSGDSAHELCELGLDFDSLESVEETEKEADSSKSAANNKALEASDDFLELEGMADLDIDLGDFEGLIDEASEPKSHEDEVGFSTADVAIENEAKEAEDFNDYKDEGAAELDGDNLDNAAFSEASKESIDLDVESKHQDGDEASGDSFDGLDVAEALKDSADLSDFAFEDLEPDSTIENSSESHEDSTDLLDESENLGAESKKDTVIDDKDVGYEMMFDLSKETSEVKESGGILDMQDVEAVKDLLKNDVETSTEELNMEDIKIESSEFASLTEEALSEALGEELEGENGGDEMVDDIFEDIGGESSDEILDDVSDVPTPAQKVESSASITPQDAFKGVQGLSIPALKELLDGMQLTISISFPNKK